jgi:hypothetical protein
MRWNSFHVQNPLPFIYSLNPFEYENVKKLNGNVLNYVVFFLYKKGRVVICYYMQFLDEFIIEEREREIIIIIIIICRGFDFVAW